jgi:peptidoglycan hydrolase-like protein with peptidoglycan-binding domain
MNTWSVAGALIVAGVLVAGPVFAQTTPSSGDKDKAKDTMKSETGAKSGQMTGNREQVKAVQQALKDKGHDPGAVDGMMGPKTQAALKEFQDKEGLKASGRIDAETMAKLGVESKTGASAGTGSSSPAASPGTTSTPSTPSTPGSAPKK